MPLLEQDTVIKEYFETVKEKYPTISFKVFSNICKMPFYYIATEMARTYMPTIIVMYMGKFKVFASKMREQIRKNNNKLHFKDISIEEHAIRDAFFKKKLAELEEDKKSGDFDIDIEIVS